MTAAVLDAAWWESPPLHRRGEAAADWAAEALAGRFGGTPMAGLYVATADSGAAESIDFWRAALDTGFGYASPKPFPWTLANSPTGRIAQRLAIRGPTYTLVGGAGALAGAAGHALDDLAGGAERVLLVALDGTSAGTVALGALALGPPGPAAAAALSRDDVAAWDDGEPATTALRRFMDRLD